MLTHHPKSARHGADSGRPTAALAAGGAERCSMRTMGFLGPLRRC